MFLEKVRGVRRVRVIDLAENLHPSLEDILPKSIFSTGFELEIIHESTFSAQHYGDMHIKLYIYVFFRVFIFLIVDGNNDIIIIIIMIIMIITIIIIIIIIIIK